MNFFSFLSIAYYQIWMKQTYDGPGDWLSLGWYSKPIGRSLISFTILLSIPILTQRLYGCYVNDSGSLLVDHISLLFQHPTSVYFSHSNSLSINGLSISGSLVQHIVLFSLEFFGPMVYFLELIIKNIELCLLFSYRITFLSSSPWSSSSKSSLLEL